MPMQLHHFAPAMVERGRGGSIVFGSGAGFVGGPNVVTYSATKTFDMVFAEAFDNLANGPRGSWAKTCARHTK